MLAAAISTQMILHQVIALGLPVPLGVRFETSGQDLVGMVEMYGPLVAASPLDCLFGRCPGAEVYSGSKNAWLCDWRSRRPLVAAGHHVCGVRTSSAARDQDFPGSRGPSRGRSGRRPAIRAAEPTARERLVLGWSLGIGNARLPRRAHAWYTAKSLAGSRSASASGPTETGTTPACAPTACPGRDTAHRRR